MFEEDGQLPCLKKNEEAQKRPTKTQVRTFVQIRSALGAAKGAADAAKGAADAPKGAADK